MCAEKYFCMQKETNMRNFKKILIIICVLSLLAVGCTVWALADESEDNVGSVAELSALITTAEAADEGTKYDAVMAAFDYLDTKKISTSEAGYTEAILRLNAVAVEAADIYLSQIPETVEGTGVDTDALVDIFMYADDLLHKRTIPDGTAGFKAVKDKYDVSLLNLSRALTKNIGTDIANEANPNTAANKIKLNRANGIITYCSPYTPNPDLELIKADFALCVAAHNEAVAKLLDELDAKNDVSSYDLPVYYEEDFEKATVGYGKDKLTNGWGYTSNGAEANRVGIRQEKNGNKYYVHEYREQKNPAGSFIQRGLSGYKTENGLVFEFSIGTFGEIPAQGILVETGSVNGSFPPPYLYINGKGDLCANDKATVLLPGALTKGGWLDIIIALDPLTFNYSLYVEGQFLAEYDASLGGAAFDHSKVALRLSGGASTQGEIAYDNFKIYAGSNYRSQDRLKNMTTEEKFVYFVDYFSKDNNPVLDRKESYDRATALVRTFCSIDTANGTYEFYPPYVDNEEIKSAVSAYMAFDIEPLIAKAKLDNLRSYVALVNRLQRITRSTTTIADRNNIVIEITNFNKVNLNLIDLECDEYTVNADGTYTEAPDGAIDYEQYTTIYNKILKQITYDTNADVFVGYMQRFERATSLSATQRYYNYAKSYVDDDLIDVSLIINTSTPGRENFKSLIDAYELFINYQVKIDAVTRSNNSKRIVQCINAINQFRTEEQWEANKEMMTEYLNIIKDSVRGTDANGDPLYDKSYEGVDEAVRFFERVYTYFYNQMQDEHDREIGYLLGLISATDDYVEKIGLVALIDRYVGNNDVDIHDARIAKHLANLETCRAELVLRGEDYPKGLQQNSVYFINFVEKMRTASTYAEQMDFYGKASELYFSLDTTVEGTLAAIAIYDEYNVKLKRTEESSIRFLEAMAIYRACENENDKYAALVDCYYNAQFAEPSYDGVSLALAEYQSAYDTYVNYATSVNNDLTSAGHAIGSLRVNCGITTIIAIIIKRLFGV